MTTRRDAQEPSLPPPLTPDALARLRDLVSAMDDHTGPWGEWHDGEELAPRTFTMPWIEPAPVCEDAMTFLYDHGRIIPFDWPDWDEGRDIFKSWTDDTAATLDHRTVLKLLTAVARNDRFVEGSWVGLFEDGCALPLFRRLLGLKEERI